ncbi:uncharacterized protein LOC131850461 [Achroia grisella]|uniref:uncharacterized protein LOC131850461 n=1 Tax=Achroia grisella TaxID=688607 RepID=UPI0027D33603|nr:uncharacterized protein LOC131850461 [Achroia grisella]
MNTNKKDNNGWILCPSKSFPGKFYYFNVTNGDTAWSLNDADKKTVTNERREYSTENMPDNSHSYPDPKTPVVDNQIPSNSHVNYINYQYPPQNPETITQPSPVFAQVVFPKYITDAGPHIQNILWTPIPISTSMLAANTPKKQTTDKNTQTFITENFSQLHVDACDIPLCKRFNNFKPPHIIFNYKNKIIIDNKNLSELPVQTTNYKSALVSQFEVNPKSSSQSDLETGDGEYQLCRNKDTSKSDTKMLNLRQSDKVENDIENKDFKVNGLENADLRFLLVAKKNKTVNVDNLPNNVDEEKSKGIGKKKVSFDLGSRNEVINLEELYYVDCAGDVDDTYKEEQNTLNILRDLASSSLRTDIWYIVVDTEILLEELAFMESFVKLDSSCRLLVPRSVMEAVLSASRNHVNENERRMMLARHLVRRLDRPPAYLVVQDVENTDAARNMSALDRIVYCCLKTSERNYHVILITNDAKLYNKAKSVLIHCYKLYEIKSGLKPEVAFKDQKIVVTVSNSNENLFLQRADQLDPFLLSKEIDFTVDVARNPLFEKARVQTMENMADTNTNTSLINVDQLTNTHFTNVSVQNKNLSVDHEGTLSITVANVDTDLQKIIRKNIETDEHDNNFPYSVDKKIENEPQDSINLLIPRSESIDKQHMPDQLKSNILNQNISNNDQDTKQILNNVPHLLNGDVEMNEQSYEIKTNNSEFQHPHMDERQNMLHIKTENEYQTLPVLDESQLTDTTISLDDKLKRFDVINKVIKHTIKSKIEEWFCSYSQVMEDALAIILQESNTLPLRPPWTVQEATVSLKEIYKNSEITEIVDKLLILLHNSCEKGKLESHKKPNYFMRIVGCSVILLRNLQVFRPDCEALIEAEQQLINMIRSIKNPVPLVDEKDLVRYSIPSHSVDDEIETPRHGFIKKPSQVMEYVQKHFPQWRKYSEVNNKPVEDNCKVNTDTKIVRTFGRNLKNLTIDKMKSLSLIQPDVDEVHINENESKETRQLGDVIVINRETRTPQNIDNTAGADYIKLDESKIVRKLHYSNVNLKNGDNRNDDNDLNFTIHGNTFNATKNDGPTVIRNIRLLDVYEEKLKKQSLLEASDFTAMSLSSITDGNFSNENLDININSTNDNEFNHINSINDTDTIILLNENYITIDSSSPLRNSDTNRDDSGTNDSGFESESIQAYSLLKIFLTELSGSLKSIYKFIDDNINEFRFDDIIEDEKKRRLHSKVSHTHCQLANIIEKLKSIIQRESKEDSELKELLIKAGTHASTDKRMTRYKQVVVKCLEQAQMLEHALRMMLALTDDDDLSISTSSRRTTRYYNLFEYA